MSATQRRAQHKELMRERILEVAEELFARDGVEAVSMRKIAERIQYSPTAIYQHFRNKAEILSVMVEADFKAMAQSYGALTEEDGLSPVDRLRGMIRGYVFFGLDNPDRYELWISNSRPDLREGRVEIEVGGKRYPAFQSWIAQIREGMDVGLLEKGDPLQIFHLLWLGAHGLVSLLGAYPEYPWGGSDAVVEGMLDMMIEGLSPTEIETPGTTGVGGNNG